ncbi:MAG: energy-coupled thiamine transporter ThiT, partial [Lachnospiraceae bacterium]|nr:energy-coupled thiamine transporter ThiT [Lachnospiraceae bacterium]
WKWGVVTAFVYSVIQLILGLDNVGYATGFAMALGVILLDYIIAYTVIGFSGIFENSFGKTSKAVFVGILVTFALRFVCHYITGVWIWKEWMPETFMKMTMTSPWIYSALYNGWYMLAELVFTEIVAMIIYKPLGRYFRCEDIKRS